MNMNILDDDGDFHTTRECYSYLSDIDWSAAKRLGSTAGEHAVRAMLSALNRNKQPAAVAKFIQHELDHSREKVTLYHQGSQEAELLGKQGAQEFELLRQQQAQTAVPDATYARRGDQSSALRVKYRGVEEDYLLSWFVELDDAYKSLSYRWWANASRIRSVELGTTCHNLGTRSQVARHISVWVVGGLQDPA